MSRARRQTPGTRKRVPPSACQQRPTMPRTPGGLLPLGAARGFISTLLTAAAGASPARRGTLRRLNPRCRGTSRGSRERIKPALLRTNTITLVDPRLRMLSLTRMTRLPIESRQVLVCTYSNAQLIRASLVSSLEEAASSRSAVSLTSTSLARASSQSARTSGMEWVTARSFRCR